MFFLYYGDNSMTAILRMFGMLAYGVAGLLGLIVCLQIIVEVGGVFLAVIAFFFFPVALGIAPWLPLLADGDWTPLLIVYGGGLVGMALFAAAAALDPAPGK